MIWNALLATVLVVVAIRPFEELSRKYFDALMKYFMHFTDIRVEVSSLSMGSHNWNQALF